MGIIESIFLPILPNEFENVTLASIRDIRFLSGEIRMKDAERFVEGVA